MFAIIIIALGIIISVGFFLKNKIVKLITTIFTGLMIIEWLFASVLTALLFLILLIAMPASMGFTIEVIGFLSGTLVAELFFLLSFIMSIFNFVILLQEMQNISKQKELASVSA